MKCSASDDRIISLLLKIILQLPTFKNREVKDGGFPWHGPPVPAHPWAASLFSGFPEGLVTHCGIAAWVGHEPPTLPFPSLPNPGLEAPLPSFLALQRQGCLILLPSSLLAPLTSAPPWGRLQATAVCKGAEPEKGPL